MAPVQARRERRLAESKQHMLQREVRIANLDLWRAGPRASAEPLRVLSISPSSSQRGGWHYLHPGQAGAGAAPALEESMLTGWSPDQTGPPAWQMHPGSKTGIPDRTVLDPPGTVVDGNPTFRQLVGNNPRDHWLTFHKRAFAHDT